jgi:hypothetical protein
MRCAAYNGTICFFANMEELKHFGGKRGVIHLGPGRRESCHHRDLVEQAHYTVLGSVVCYLGAAWLD